MAAGTPFKVMRHFFIIHSHTTHRCATGVIAASDLPAERCVFGTARGFEPPPCSPYAGAIPAHSLPFLQHPNGNAIRPVLRLRRLRDTLDHVVTELMEGRSFHCYVPHTYFDSYQLLATHSRCAGFSYIEEGLTSYYRPSEIERAYPTRRFSLRTCLLRRAFFGRRIGTRIPFFREDYSTAFGFTDSSFPDWPRRATLGLEHLCRVTRSNPVSSPPVLVFDALVELGLTSLEALLEALRELCRFLVSGGTSRLLFKFHPNQDNEGSMRPIERVFHEFREMLDIVRMDQDLSLEDYFVRHSADIYIFNSAAGLYAALQGQRVISLNPLLVRFDASYARAIAAQPEIFHSLVSGIDTIGDLR